MNQSCFLTGLLMAAFFKVFPLIMSTLFVSIIMTNSYTATVGAAAFQSVGE